VRKDTTATSSGYPNFTINPPGDRPEYYVVTYTSSPNPVVSSSSAFGRDYLTYQERGEVIKQAIDTDMPVVTSIITIIGSSPRKGFLIFMPMYQNGIPTATLQERRDAALGVISSVFISDDLFKTILAEQKISKLDFEVYDTGETKALTQENLLYDSKIHDDIPQFSQDRLIRIGGRVWTLHLSTQPGYGIETTQFFLPFVIIPGGISLSILLSISLYLILNSRRRALSLAGKMTKELSDKEAEYRTIFDTLLDVYYRTDMTGKITTITPSIEHYIGIPPSQLIGRDATEFYFDSGEREKMLQKLQQTGNILDYPLTLKGRNQEPIYVSLTGHLLFDKNKKPIGIEGILRDVSARKKVEDELQAKTQDLERMNKIMIGRELTMIELKKEVEELKRNT
jgi:PAS domain S-box-containing protein